MRLQPRHQPADRLHELFAQRRERVLDAGRHFGIDVARASFDAQRGRDGALLIGSPDEVADKILRHAEALGGVSRISFQMNAASLPQVKMMRAIDAIGARVLPMLRQVETDK